MVKWQNVYTVARVVALTTRSFREMMSLLAARTTCGTCGKGKQVK